MVTGWKKAKIGELTDIVNGGTPSTAIAEYWNGGINWCTPSDITKKKTKYLSNTEKTITEKGLSESSASLLPIGTILLCSRATIGEMSIAASEMATNQGFKNLICKKDVDNEFLYYALFPLRNKMLELAIGTTFLEISKSALQSIEVIIPADIIEQTAIAGALSDVDSLISSLQELIEKKKAIKQGTMQELLTGKKRLLGFSGEWETRKVGELCSIVTKQTGFDYTSTIKPNLIEHPQSNALPMIQTKNFEGRKFDFSTDYYIPADIAKEFDKIVLDTVCLLFSIVGASVGNIGLFPGDKVAFCGGAIGIAKFYHEIDAIYAFYYFLSESGQQQIRNVTKGGAQATVTIEDIREFTMPYPSLKERAMVAQTLSDMDSEIEQLEKKLAKYQQIKQGMMQELLTGRIRLV